ncbi:MAG: hypothetical protein KAV00_02720, partial [Phycisphaerae bacterium]|nr:hypothetical protein [Phycisphaerae bacterium]
LKLTWKGRSLRLDHKQWEKDFEGKTKDEVLKILESEIRGRGNWGGGDWPVREARRMLNMNPAERAFKRLQSAVGSGGSSGSSSGSGRRSMHFEGGDLRGRIDIAGKSVKLMLEEMSFPGRRLEVLDDGWGTLRIILSDSSGKLLLVVGQGEKGRISVAHISGDTVFAATGESFKDFYAKHQRYVDERFFPVLKHMGIVVPWGQYNPKVKQTVLAKIIGPMTPDQAARGKMLIEQLNDNSFKKRQEATGILSTQFARYRELIEQAAKKKSNPPETASRLKKIVKENTRQDDIEEFVTGRKLATNVGYLIRLIGDVPADDRAVVAGALQRLTKQKFGPDPIAWKKWWSKKQTGKSTTKTGKLK